MASASASEPTPVSSVAPAKSGASVPVQRTASARPAAAPAADAPAVAQVLGYDPDFLGTHIGVPELDAELAPDAVLLDGSAVVPYTHFSLTLSASRRFAFWVAWNIDGGLIKKLSRTGIDFVKDPRLPADVQVGNELYEGNDIDRGHLARRADLLWGTLPEAGKANTDSFYYSNITPQMANFNQAARSGLWGELEDAVFEDVDIDDLRVSVFGGPVFRDDDRVYRGVRIPREFWKTIVFTGSGTLGARSFLLTQNLDHLETVLDLDDFRVYEVTVGELEERTRLRFPAALHAADAPAALAPETGRRAPLESLADIRWTA